MARGEYHCLYESSRFRLSARHIGLVALILDMNQAAHSREDRTESLNEGQTGAGRFNLPGSAICMTITPLRRSRTEPPPSTSRADCTPKTSVAGVSDVKVVDAGAHTGSQ